MVYYQEILRLTALGCSQREMCVSVSDSQNAVVKIQKQALELGLAWPLDVSVTDGILKQQKLFLKEQAASSRCQTMSTPTRSPIG